MNTQEESKMDEFLNTVCCVNYSTGQVMDNTDQKTVQIAIGLGITSKESMDMLSQHGADSKIVQNCTRYRFNIPFVQSLLKTFCHTASSGYNYNFYLAYDHDDNTFNKTQYRKELMCIFNKYTTNSQISGCPNGSTFTLTFIECNFSQKPAWAQNAAMLKALKDGNDYFYRINDDTLFKTRKWTEKFIGTLQNLDPPNIGVVGPTYLTRNKQIYLTYEFVHRTHFDIFGFYYPKLFKSWSADKWITEVYYPERSVRRRDIIVDHTMDRGTRYMPHVLNKTDIQIRLIQDRNTLSR